MHILITGGAGFIGSNLARTLLRRGDSISILDNLSTGRLDNVEDLMGHGRFSFAFDDISNLQVLDRLASEADVIVHLAAAVGVELVVARPTETIETNVLGTHVVLAAVLSGGIFGDHASPISDTTILSFIGAGCTHVEHVRTQLPYASTAGVAALAGFLLAAVWPSAWALGPVLALLFAMALISHRLAGRAGRAVRRSR